jgi:hypothetical protein
MTKQILLATLLALFSVATFGQKKVSNYYSVEGYNEQTAKSYLDRYEIDPIEGIWQSNDGFKYAIEKDVETDYVKMISSE